MSYRPLMQDKSFPPTAFHAARKVVEHQVTKIDMKGNNKLGSLAFLEIPLPL